MKIFVPFKISDVGGTSNFAKKFQESMEKIGHKVFFDFIDDYDILFLIVQCPIKYIWDAKKKGKRIIQRLDGCWYWSVSGWKYWLYNLKARIIYRFFADFYIFQSEYSKYSCEKFLGKIRKKYAVIYNGVDLEKFSPTGEKINMRDNINQKIFFTASVFRREDQIVPIIKALEIYKRKYDKNFKFIVAGNFKGKATGIPAKYKNVAYLKFIGKIENNYLPKYERAADVFLHTHLNPPCPNNVIEALACGLPICGVADGAMKELTIPGKNSELMETTGDAFWRKRKYDLEQFAFNINNIMMNRSSYCINSRKFSERCFSLDRMVNEYNKILIEITT